MRRKSNSIPKLHIKKDDTVKVISGDDKGKIGRVTHVFPGERKIKVEGVAAIIKHSKPTTQNPEGGRIDGNAKIDISKVMLVDPKTKQPTRVGRKVNAEGKTVRISVKTKEEIK